MLDLFPKYLSMYCNSIKSNNSESFIINTKSKSPPSIYIENV